MAGTKGKGEEKKHQAPDRCRLPGVLTKVKGGDQFDYVMVQPIVSKKVAKLYWDAVEARCNRAGFVFPEQSDLVKAPSVAAVKRLYRVAEFDTVEADEAVAV